MQSAGRCLIGLPCLLLLTACGATRPPAPAAVSGPVRIILDGTIPPVSKKEQALVVVDGRPRRQRVLRHLTPDDIDSTRILKGVVAESRYGPAGHNGALLIYTKKGRK